MLNAQKAYVRNLIKEHRKLAWDRFTSTLNFQDRSLYKLNRRLLHKKPATAPLTTNSGQKIYDTESKIELFADTMKYQFTANPGNEFLEGISSQKCPINIRPHPRHWNINNPTITYTPIKANQFCEIIKSTPHPDNQP
ncbi:hypothetical protein QTP88_014556 [Uroleucon formosanum]